MERRDGFRLFLVAQFLYGIAMAIFGGHLPDPHPPTSLSALQLAVGIPMMVASLGGLVGIWLFRRWGRWLYSAGVLITLVNLATMPSRLEIPMPTIWPALGWLMTGITVTLIYTSPLAAEFVSPAA